MEVSLLVSGWTCGFNLSWNVSLVRSLLEVQITYGEFVMLGFYMIGLGASLTMREVESSPNSYANCHYGSYQDTLSA